MNSRIEQHNPVPILITLLGCLLALGFGSLVGGGQYHIVLVGLAVGYAVYFYRLTWQTSALLIFTGFFYRPLGFAIGSGDLYIFLFTALLFVIWWRKPPTVILPATQTSIFRIVYYVSMALMVYYICHAAFNTLSPYIPGELSYRTQLRTYIPKVFGLFIFLYFTRNTSTIIVKENFIGLIGSFLLISVLVNIAIRTIDAKPLDQIGLPDEMGAGLYIPILNATANQYILRLIGPFAALFGAVFLASGFHRNQSRPKLYFILFLSLTIFGITGSALSGGRGALILSMLYVMFALFFFRKYFKLCLCAGILFSLVLSINLGASLIRAYVPPIFQRSLEWVIFDEASYGKDSINASAEWRKTLKMMALEEWKSDPRIFWFGRSTFPFTSKDLQMLSTGREEEGLITGLRRAATHHDFTDALVTFGAVGFSLAYLLMILQVFFYRKMMKLYKKTEPAVYNLCTMMWLTAILTLLGHFISNNPFYCPSGLFIIVILAYLSRKERARLEQEGLRSKEAITDPRPASLAAGASL